jgi:hypothetical protein
MLGQEWLTLEAEQNEIAIDADHLPAGEYILYVTSEEAEYSTTIVKE